MCTRDALLAWGAFPQAKQQRDSPQPARLATIGVVERSHRTDDSDAHGPAPRLQRFELLRVLGSGGTGITYEARARVGVGSVSPGQVVALKLLRRGLVEQVAAREAFLREARIGMDIRHPNLVRVHAAEEVRTADGERVLYLVEERVMGRTLRAVLDDGELLDEATLRILGRQIAGALAALHGAGLLHLDVKPDNILWTEEEARAVLIDLGFVRPHHDLDDVFCGTPAYAAPEMLHESRAESASDLFSLGVTLYEAAAGLRPFGDEGIGIFEARRRAVRRRPSSHQPRISPFTDRVIVDLLHENPAKRFRDAVELARALTEGESSVWWQRNAKATPLLPEPRANRLPLVGREEEWAVLERSWRAVRRDRKPRVVVLGGIASVGKTRLAREFAERQRGAASTQRGDEAKELPALLYGRALRLGRGSAFRPLRDALARSLGLAGDQPPGASVARRLKRHLPPDSAATLLALLAGEERTRVQRQRAFGAWLRAVGAEGPFLLLLDDIGAAGPALWSWVESLLAEEGLPGLILLAHRPDLDTTLAKARRSLLSRRRTRELLLSPLSGEAIRALLQTLFAEGALQPDLASDLADASDGVPGRLDVLLRHLRQRGDLEGSFQALRPTRSAIELPLFATTAELLAQTVAELDGNKRRALQAASLFAPPLSVAMLAGVLGRTELATSRVLAGLASGGWLRNERGRYRFTRPRLREAVYRTLRDSTRRRLHRRVYGLLIEGRIPFLDADAARAFHADRGSMPLEAVRTGVPRLQRFLRQGAWGRAERMFAKLSQHWEALDADTRQRYPRTAVHMLLLEARLAGRGEDREREAALLQDAGHLAGELDSDRLRGQVHLGLVRHARGMGFGGAARFHLERARSYLM